MSNFINSSGQLSNQNPFSQWKREMNDLFERFNRDIGANRFLTTSISPNVELVETDRNYQVTLEVPGMNENNLKVSLKDNRLIVEGTRKQIEYTGQSEICFSELNFGDVLRELSFDEEINANTIKATCHDGLLHVTLDKLEPGLHQVKRIPIQKS
jgi:HSP20 family protein